KYRLGSGHLRSGAGRRSIHERVRRSDRIAGAGDAAGMSPARPPRAHWRLSAALFTARPRLTRSFALGTAVGVGLLLVPQLRWATDFMLGWDIFCLLFLALAARMVAGEGPEEIAARAATQDEGRPIILFLVIGVPVASLAAVAA